MRCSARLIVVVALVSCFAGAQKVKVGFDKSVDFSKYHSYSWAPSAVPQEDIPPRRVLAIIAIDDMLAKKGLQLQKEGGDLLLYGSGDFDTGIGGVVMEPIMSVRTPAGYSMSTTMWSGVPISAGSIVTSGVLLVEFVDQAAKKVVWQGTASTKLDHTNRQKDLERIRAAIQKLIDNYPPKK